MAAASADWLGLATTSCYGPWCFAGPQFRWPTMPPPAECNELVGEPVRPINCRHTHIWSMVAEASGRCQVATWGQTSWCSPTVQEGHCLQWSTFQWWCSYQRSEVDPKNPRNDERGPLPQRKAGYNTWWHQNNSQLDLQTSPKGVLCWPYSTWLEGQLGGRLVCGQGRSHHFSYHQKGGTQVYTRQGVEEQD